MYHRLARAKILVDSQVCSENVARGTIGFGANEQNSDLRSICRRIEVGQKNRLERAVAKRIEAVESSESNRLDH